MASLALGLAGAAIGSYVGGPTGAQIGWALGSTLGSYIDASHQHSARSGPRLGDKTVQTSSYGQMIPMIRGTIGTAGNVIWASDLVEVSHTEEEGGKGGPSVEVTTYSYFANLAVSLGEGPMRGGILRIWADGRLWYDSHADPPGQTLGWRFYPGDEEQLPDPTIEAYMGAGNVPAYRGQCYVVFTMLPLESFGNRIPSLFFEVCESADSGDRSIPIGSGWPIDADAPNVLMYDGARALWGVTRTRLTAEPYGIQTLYRVDPYSGATIDRWDINNDFPTYTQEFTPIGPAGAGGLWALGQIGVTSGYNPSVIWRLDTEQHVPLMAAGTEGYQYFAWTQRGGDLLIMRTQYGASGPLPGIEALYVTAQSRTVAAHSGSFDLTDATGPSPTLVASGATDGSTYFVPVMITGPARYGLLRFDAASMASLGFTLSPFPPGTVGVTNIVYCAGYVFVALADGNIDRWNPATLTVDRLDTGMPNVTVAISEEGFLLAASGVSTRVIDPRDWTPTGMRPTFAGGGSLTRENLTGRVMGMVDSGSVRELLRIRTGELNDSGVSLGDVVMRYCQRVGLNASNVDVSDIETKTIRGAVIARQGAARDAITPLAQAFYFDGVESDAAIRFRFRGGTPIATIPTSDMAATGDDVPTVKIDRKQDADLPRTVNVSYFEPARDYQAGSQYARRLAGEAVTDTTVEIPVPFTADEAKAIAETWLYNAWAERAAYQWATSRKYALLEPGDLVWLAGQYYVRINKRSEEGGLLRWEGAGDAAQIYIQHAPGGSGQGGEQTPPTVYDTAILYLDVPLLRDQDDHPGFYVAGSGYPPEGWPGAAIYKSVDGGATWAALYSLTRPTTHGSTGSALGPFDPRNNIFDETNAVTVYLGAGGNLVSTTDLGVMNGANHVLIGAEVLQYKLATQIADGVFILTGLLRGRLGTEWAIGTHVYGERFVLLGANLRDISQPSSEINQPRNYKSTTLGYPLPAGAGVSFTNTGIRHKPYAPVQIGGGRLPSGDWLFGWARRTRYTDGWQDNVDAPLGEASEAYELEIMSGPTSGATVKRTLTGLSSPSATYPSAQQIADFGSNQSTVTVRVYQLSAVLGRGYAGSATLNG